MAHGGDRYGSKIDLDFSVNLNPMGISDEVIENLKIKIGAAEYYPDIDSKALNKELSSLIGCLDENIALGNGASELMMAAVHALKPKKILIPAPSFSGYEYAANAAEADIEFYETGYQNEFSLNNDFLSLVTNDIDILFLANPNNPTGKYIKSALLEKIIKKCGDKNITVILDECFMELSDSPGRNSFLRKIKEYPRLILLRSFTKTFAIAGLRLGYILCADGGIIHAVKRHLPEWNISSMAQAAGEAALRELKNKELENLKAARLMVRRERAFLEKALAENGFLYLKSDANFILFKTPDNFGADLYNELKKRHILIRDCSDYRGLFKGWYRIAVRPRGENLTLLSNIRDIIKLSK